MAAQTVEPMSGQQQLFRPPPPPAPDFDEMCPPRADQQLELEIGSAIASAAQTTFYDHDC